MKRWLREPLLHFLLLGLAIFAAFAVLGPDREPRSAIVVTRGIIDGQVAAFTRTWLRPPTPEEVDGLIREYVREEVYYREGMKLGLDRDDTVIRRRLKQKLEFVAEAEGVAAEPTDAQLQAWLDAHPEQYLTDERYSFVQVFLDPERHGDAHADDTARLLDELRRGGNAVDPAELGDPTLLEREFADVAARDVVAQFGEEFAAQLAQLAIGTWQGPVASAYGSHLVLVRGRTTGRQPHLDEVRDALRRDWLNDQRIAATERYYRSLLEGYTVTIDGREVWMLDETPRAVAP